MIPPEIITDIERERQRQDEQWGGAEHDDTHGSVDWMRYRRKFEDRVLLYDGPQTRRDALIKIAALAIAQIESLARKQEKNRARAATARRAMGWKS